MSLNLPLNTLIVSGSDETKKVCRERPNDIKDEREKSNLKKRYEEKLKFNLVIARLELTLSEPMRWSGNSILQTKN